MSVAIAGTTTLRQWSNFAENSYVCVTGSKSTTYMLRQEKKCTLHLNKTSVDKVGLPLKVSVVVMLCPSSSLSTSSRNHILDHKTELTFWIPYDEIFSDNARDIMSKIIYLMNVPFSLEDNLNWRDTEQYGKIEITAILENKDMLISKIVDSVRSMMDSPASPYDKVHSFINLEILKVTHLSQIEFLNKLKNIEPDHNIQARKRPQGVIGSRLEKLDALQKDLGLQKMRFVSEGSNLLEMCLICREDFSVGSTVLSLKSCSHIYHETCFLEWLLKNRSCPYCRSELK
nr:RING finger protein 150-like [Nicotiana tomentosiformis]